MADNNVSDDQEARIATKRWLGILALTLLSALPGNAQHAPKTRPPMPDKKNIAPTYPGMLESAGIGGAVRVTFAIDSTGLPIITSFRVRTSDHDLFTAAVKDAVSSWRYTPAHLGRENVADTIEQFVEFVPRERGPQEIFRGSTVALKREETGPRQWRLVVTTKEVKYKLKKVADSLHLAIGTAAMDAVMGMTPGPSDHPPRIACISLGTPSSPVDPPVSLLKALSRPTYTAVAARRCPRTYSAMARVVDTLPPPGEDPWRFTPLVPQGANDSTTVIDVETSQGTMSRRYRCVARRDDARAIGWRAECRGGSIAVH